LGYERRYNSALQLDDQKTFIEFMTAGQPLRPANIANIVAINQGQRPLTMEEPSTDALSPSDAEGRIEAGCIILDTRSQGEFGRAHIPGACNIQLTSKEFEQRVGWVTPLDTPIVLVTEKDSQVTRALRSMAFVGLDQRVQGYLAGGMNAWLEAGLPQNTLPQISVDQVHERLHKNGDLKVLDVRETSEWEAGHIQGGHYMNFKHLPLQLEELEITRQDETAVICASGMRSNTAASILLMNGFEHISNVSGGMQAWSKAGLPMIDAGGQLIQS
jgi:hydroxyacylglutathione hydrolase